MIQRYDTHVQENFRSQYDWYDYFHSNHWNLIFYDLFYKIININVTKVITKSHVM